MTAYECDRFGTLFKRECMPKTTIAKKIHCGFYYLDLCPKCQEELENWFDGVQIDSSLNSTLRNGE